MNDNRCACPSCTCVVDANALIRDGKAYCCAACADRHPEGCKQCRDAECRCGDPTVRDKPKESQVDNALEETFPASDPISP
ncbi:metallothionein [Pseudomonas sp. BN417]|uniref:metallothionein n=1 Tax=Pseudomonas sp. BN417 TaxID=2567890 RepID=UPI00245391E6|nr:metallothionein [Pseudomonas sp. BN417]MDH4557468.1 metallothionein [Pseudomonas sp. BN417]